MLWALSIPAPACDYLQLQVAPNYVWSLKRLTFDVTLRTNSFLETFVRDKGTKPQKALHISAAAKEEPAGSQDAARLLRLSRLLYTYAQKPINSMSPQL